MHRLHVPSRPSVHLLALVALLGAGCTGSSIVDDGSDASTNPAVDAGTNPAVDAGTNPPVDAGTDSAVDAGTVGDPDAAAPSCGDQLVNGTEICDTGIASGLPGACPTSCDDAIACTTDALVGAGTCAAHCTHADIVAPAPGDACCPAGEDSLTDSDCPIACGNELPEAGEECDDGNGTRWDGCHECRVEQVLRITSLAILGSDPAACAALPHRSGTSFNVVGPALDHSVSVPGTGTVNGLTMINAASNASIANGTMISLAHPFDLDASLDARLGQNDASIRLALFAGGVPSGHSFDDSAGGMFEIVHAESQLVGAARDPAPGQILAPGSIVDSALVVGGGTSDVTLLLDLGSGPVPVGLHDAVAYATLANDGFGIAEATSGVFCGSIAASVLDQIQLTNATITAACGERSMLDVLARGCWLGSTIVSATQPNVDLGGDGFPSVNEFQGPVGVNTAVNVCFDSSANQRIPASGTDANCPQNPAIDDSYGVALGFTAVWVQLVGARTGP